MGCRCTRRWTVTRLQRRHWRCHLRWSRRHELMSGTRKWNSGIAARGSIYVANDNRVYAFRVPGGTPTPSPTASPTPTATATATATATPQQRQLPLQHLGHRDGHRNRRVRQRHPDQPPLRDPVRHRGRGRLRRQGPRCNQLGQATTARAAERRLRDPVPDLAAVNARGYGGPLLLT